MVVRALTKRRPAPCLHPGVLPTPPHSLRPSRPILPLGKGEEKTRAAPALAAGEEEGKGPCQEGLLLLLLLASRRRCGEPSGGRAEPGGEQSCWQLGWGGRGIKKKSLAAALLPPLSPGKGAEEAGLPATSEEAGTEP